MSNRTEDDLKQSSGLLHFVKQLLLLNVFRMLLKAKMWWSSSIYAYQQMNSSLKHTTC